MVVCVCEGSWDGKFGAATTKKMYPMSNLLLEAAFEFRVLCACVFLARNTRARPSRAPPSRGASYLGDFKTWTAIAGNSREVEV